MEAKLNQIDKMTRVKHHRIDFRLPPSHISRLNRIASFADVCLYARNKADNAICCVLSSIPKPRRGLGKSEKEMLLISTVCWLINKNRENEIIKHNSSWFVLRKKNEPLSPLRHSTESAARHRDVEWRGWNGDV